MIVSIGCSDAKGGGNKSTTPSNVKHLTMRHDDGQHDTQPTYNDEDYVMVDPVELHLDDMTFEDAFKLQYRMKGEGRTFWWRGDEYTTDLAIILPHIEWHPGTSWVLNSDDLDDNCYSNDWDECNICDGPGKTTWYKDTDGDGLGNPTIYVKACTYPGVDEE